MLFLALLPAALGLSCYKYQCSNLDGNTCISYANNTYSIDPCSSSNEYCPLTAPGSTEPSTCTKLTPTTGSKSYPGEPCSNSTDCVYGNCTAHECFNGNTTCTLDTQCNPGHYCSNGLCTTQLAVNATGCTSETSCVNNAFCDFNQTQSKCIAYYTLPALTPVAYCKASINPACQSGYCASDTTGSQYLCTPTLESFFRIPAACTDSSNCRAVALPSSNFTTNSIVTECSCGYNSYANAYCGLFNGDSPAQNYISQLKAWISSSEIKECNTARRFESDCYDAFWDKSNADKLTLYKTYTQNYPFLVDNSDCVKATYTSFYWSLDSTPDNDDDDSAAWLAATLGLFLAVA